MKKVGVVLARLQPVHNGHLALINKAYTENEDVYVFVGSADKLNARNPLPIQIRVQLLKDALENNELYKFDDLSRIHIVPLSDLTNEKDNSHDWGFYLYSKIVSHCEVPNFTIYYSDGFEIITTWFPGFILKNNVSLALLARNATEGGISATEVRKMILDSKDELKAHVPPCVYEMREAIKNHMLYTKDID